MKQLIFFALILLALVFAPVSAHISGAIILIAAVLVLYSLAAELEKKGM